MLARHPQSLPSEILTQYVVSAFMGLLTWWLNNHSPYTAEQMNVFFRQLVEPGIMEVSSRGRNS